MSALCARKAAFERTHRASPWATKDLPPEERWMEADDRLLQEEVERTRVGLSFFCVK